MNGNPDKNEPTLVELLQKGGCIVGCAVVSALAILFMQMASYSGH